jgi:hypothetical protein
MTEQLLTRGSQAGVVVAGGANSDTDIYCVGDSTLVVQLDATGAASGDWDVDVIPFGADNTTLGAVGIQPDSSSGPTHVGGRITFYARYNVQGLERVRIRFRNTTGGNLTVTRSSWRLQ